MVGTQGRSHRLKTGAKVHPARKKRKFELTRPPIETKIGLEKKKIVRTRGANKKIKLFSASKVNVVDNKGIIKCVPIKSLVENRCSVDYSRRSIITKGAILQTDLGYVKVTSRPGQDGIVNGVLVDYKK